MVDPAFGLSGIILNTESDKIPLPEFSPVIFSLFMGFGNSFGIVFPVSICFSFLSSAFQFIPEFVLSVLTPIFIDSPGLTDSEDVKIITP